jgi:uncharacterized protein (TIGR02145 family)
VTFCLRSVAAGVKIGKQMWMAENLHYQPEYDPQTGKSWCCDDDESLCGKLRETQLQELRYVCPLH